MTILGCLVDCVVPFLTFVGRLVLGSGIAGRRLCKGGNDRFPRIKIFLGYAGAGGGGGPSCKEGNDRFQKKQICLGYGVRRGLYARGKTIDFQKKKKNSAMGGHNVAKSK